VPCSARLVVLAFLTPVFFGAQAWWVAAAFVALNLAVLMLGGIVLGRTLFRRQRVFFIMEVPLYHAPNVRTIARFVGHNLWAFVRRAGSLIVLFSAALWALGYFPGPGLEHSVLGAIGRGLAPLGAWMGLDWRLLVALVASFVAKENAIAALGVLFGAAADDGLAAALATGIAPASALSFLAATMLFIPCVATVAVMRRETGSWAWTLTGVALTLVAALVGATLVYQSCRLLGFGL
jgi:ferrous iron transport protein B